LDIDLKKNITIFLNYYHIDVSTFCMSGIKRMCFINYNFGYYLNLTVDC